MGSEMCIIDRWYDTLKVMGNSLGRFIYILDAYDDLLEDKKKGRYNALRTYENNKDFDIFIENVLNHIWHNLPQALRAFLLLRMSIY